LLCAFEDWRSQVFDGQELQAALYIFLPSLITMLFTKVLFVTLLGFVAANVQSKQADVPLLGMIESMSKSIQAVTSEAQKFSGENVEQAAKILSTYDELLAVINKSTAQLKTLPSLRAREAVLLLEPAGLLIAQLDTLVSTIGARKRDFDSNGISSVVLDTFVSGKKAAKDFFDVLDLKVPAKAVEVSEGIGKQLDAALTRGVRMFSR
jgi:Hydrophobic surface binding protein A